MTDGSLESDKQATMPFGTNLSPEHVDEAVLLFRDYRARRYGLLLVGACVANALGFGLAFWLIPEPSAVLIPPALIAFLGPVWLCDEYFWRPARRAARIRRSLPPSVQVTLDATRIALIVEGKEASVRWQVVKAVIEGKGVCLLVLSPFTFLFFPSAALTQQARETLHAKAQIRSA